MKYCVDCKWFRPAENFANDDLKVQYGTCAAPLNVVESGLSPRLVEYRCEHASVQRKHPTRYMRKYAPLWWSKQISGDPMCGPHGDWWEPKP